MSVYNLSSLDEEFIKLKSSSTPVLNGYGEYVVYRPSGKLLSEKVFAEVFQRIQNRIGTYLENKTECITKELRAQDEDLEILFIPRTLYELTYIVAAIEEEKTWICSAQKTSIFPYLKSDGYLKKDTCWHIICGTDQTPIEKQDPDLYHLAYRLNQYCLENLFPIEDLKTKKKRETPFTGREIVALTKEKLEFLKAHKKTFEEKLNLGEVRGFCEAMGVSINFGLNQSRGEMIVCRPMGIESKKEENLIYRALALECHQMAQNAYILYRAGYWNLDQQIDPENFNSTSLSYGTSLFSGCVRDGSACVFWYAKNTPRTTYAVVVPYQQEKESPFYIPKTHTLVQLLSNGEFFHARSKFSAIDNNFEEIQGVGFLSKGVDIPEALFDKRRTAKEIASRLKQFHQNHTLILNDEKTTSDAK